jgi:glutathione S-transferase
MNQLIEGQVGNYCFGNDVTLADVFLVPQMSVSAERFDIDISTYKNLHKAFMNAKDLPAFVKARPEQQPDFQP